jgi:hypothetical protein
MDVRGKQPTAATAAPAMRRFYFTAFDANLAAG